MEHEAIFREFVEATNVMMWRTDTEANRTYFNGSWLHFTGRELAAESGLGWRDGLHPDDLDPHRDAMFSAFQARRPFTVEYRLRRHDGVFRWVEETGRPLVRAGDFIGYFGSCHDVTAGKEAEAEIARGLAEKEALLAEVYHRVRNNLQIMVSLVGFYGRAAPDPCRPAFVALMQRVRAIALVQQHLHETTQIAQIDARDYLERLAAGFAQLGPSVDVAVHADGADLPHIAPRTANALGMVVAEIVSEGLESVSRSERSRLEIRLSPGGAHAIEVTIEPDPSAEPARSAVSGAPKLGQRLITAYAAQAGITILEGGVPGEDGATPASRPLRLRLPTGADVAPAFFQAGS